MSEGRRRAGAGSTGPNDPDRPRRWTDPSKPGSCSAIFPGRPASLPSGVPPLGSTPPPAARTGAGTDETRDPGGLSIASLVAAPSCPPGPLDGPEPGLAIQA